MRVINVVNSLHLIEASHNQRKDSEYLDIKMLHCASGGKFESDFETSVLNDGVLLFVNNFS